MQLALTLSIVTLALGVLNLAAVLVALGRFLERAGRTKQDLDGLHAWKRLHERESADRHREVSVTLEGHGGRIDRLEEDVDHLEERIA